MPATINRVTRSQSKRKIATFAQPTISEAFAKKRDLAQAHTTDTHGPTLPVESVIEFPSAPVTPASVSEPDLVPEVVIEDEPRPTTTKVSGTIQPDGSKPKKVFPLFNRSKPPAATQSPPEDTPVTHPSSRSIDFSRSDESFLQASEAPKPPPVKSRVKKGRSVPSNNENLTGFTADDPIVLDLSPTRTRSFPVKIKPFDARAPFKLKSRQGSGSLNAPLPSGETQHVRGPQSVFRTADADIPFKRRSRVSVASTSAGEPSSLSLAGIIDYPQDPLISSDQRLAPPSLTPHEIPAEYIRQHPVFETFSRTADHSDAKVATAELWVDIWIPYLAEHVLGNEEHAIYLRDWLVASEINSFSGSVDPSTTSTPASSQPKKKPPAKRGTKRARIRREVGSKKVKKRRRRETDWIVDDERGSRSEPSDAESHPLDAYLEGDPYSNMSNTIILCGPPGCGKSTAVHACADELGWEVFEVYPGIGKRSGTALDNLIGQVGSNHLVTKRGEKLLSSAWGDDGLKELLGVAAAQNPSELGLADGSSEGTDVPDIGGIEIDSDDGLGIPAPPPQNDHPPTAEPGQGLHAQAKQSLILLEEVDILYRDDVNFWPKVVDIIRDCRRPVVLTCNDINLLPLDQLPVQKILSFTQPPAPVISAFVSAICRAEGIQPSEHFFTPQAGSVVDLRQCMNQCQFGTPIRSPSATETSRNNWKNVLEERACFPLDDLSLRGESQQHEAFRLLARHADNISYIDSCLVLDVDMDLPNSSSADDELGYKILPTGELTPPEFTYYHHDVELAEEVLSLTSKLSSCAGSLLGTWTTGLESPKGSGSEKKFALENARLGLTSSSHRSWMYQLAADLAVIPPFDQRLFLEYESVVREMVIADDYVEARIANALEAEAAQCGQFGRQTRSSQRLKVGFYRYLDLQPDRKDWLARTAFGGRAI